MGLRGLKNPPQQGVSRAVTKMNSLTQCIVLLACVTLSTSAAIKSCRCLQTVPLVPYNLITDVTVYDPRPYCNKREVIVKLNDGTERCLDPKSKFTGALLQKRKQEKARHDKTNTSSTTAAPVSS